jgi:tRNA-Thr(GGU) m(6)t(6)A37 methyltransferase TsaA
MTIVFNPVGIIHAPYPHTEGTPIQPVFSKGQQCRVEIFPKYRAGLADLEGFSPIHLIYFMHRVEGSALTCTPFLDTREHGIFATRAPRRPNPIGFSVVELLGIDGGMLTVGGVDTIDGTPLLDIKPYVPDFDVRQQLRTGWYENAGNKQQTVADERFVHKEK